MTAEHDDRGDVVACTEIGCGRDDLAVHLPGQRVGRRSRQQQRGDAGLFVAGVRRMTNSFTASGVSRAVALGRPVVAGGVVPVAVEELDLPVAVAYGARCGSTATIWRSTASTSATVRPFSESSCVHVGGNRNDLPPANSSSAACGRRPECAVGFGVVAVGALALRQRPDEEVGVVAAGALLFRRHPVRPRPQQVGAQHEVLLAQELAERQRSVCSSACALLAVDRRVARRCRPGSSAGPANSTPDSSKVSRAAAQTNASARSASTPNRSAHQAGSGPNQAMSA